MTVLEVHVRGSRVISCATDEEAASWAELLGTDYAPATVVPVERTLLDALGDWS